MKIKLCGMTRREDARAAGELGADFIGMVLHARSRRQIDLIRAREIIDSIPDSVEPVGMFVDASADQIRETAGRLGLRYVQLHGNESPETVAALSGLAVFKAIPGDRRTLAEQLRRWMGVTNLAALLLDSAANGQSGGTGIENDWQAIKEARSIVPNLPPLILAGGLNAANVAGVIRDLNPWAVDVSSGIESSVGIKSQEKMEAFVKAVRGG